MGVERLLNFRFSNPMVDAAGMPPVSGGLVNGAPFFASFLGAQKGSRGRGPEAEAASAKVRQPPDGS